MTNVTLGILVAIFVVQVVTGQGVDVGIVSGNADPLFRHGGMQPASVALGDYYRLFTSMFLHLSVLHILFNGWALLIFGRFVEEQLGRAVFAVVFLLGGLSGSVASYVFAAPFVPSAGASGAIVAIFGTFIVYNYRRRASAMSRANLQSAIIIIALNVFLTIQIRSIDWRAHLGGLVGGIVLGAVFDYWSRGRNRTALRVLGVVGFAAALVALVVWRTIDLRDQFGIEQLRRMAAILG